MDDPEVIDVLLGACDLYETAELSDDLLEVEAGLVAFLRLRHDEPDANEVGVCALEVSDDLVFSDLGLVSLECAWEEPEFLDVFDLVVELEEASELAFDVAEPLAVRLNISAEYVNLDEVIEIFEEL